MRLFMRAAYTIDLFRAPCRGTLYPSLIETDAMKMTIAPVLFCALALPLAACSDKPPPAQSNPAAATTGAQTGNTPWSAMKQDEQRAKDAAKATAQAQDNEQQQIQQQSQ
jgi:hypothetical protein